MGPSKIRTISVYVFKLAEDGPRYLALERAHGIDRLSGTWQAVHGRVDEDETALQAAIRELREETGARPLAFWQLDYVEAFYVADQDEVELVPCFAAQLEGDVEISDEHSAAEWLRLNEIMNRLVWRNQRQAIRELHESIAMRLHEGLETNPCSAINPKYYRELN